MTRVRTIGLSSLIALATCFAGLVLSASTDSGRINSRAAVASGAACPIHGETGAYFTGKTKTVDGVLLHEYKCSSGGGHTFWVAQRTPEKSRSQVQCPIHGDSGPYFTGKTKTVDGVLLHEYRCASGGGHSFWMRPPVPLPGHAAE